MFYHFLAGNTIFREPGIKGLQQISLKFFGFNKGIEKINENQQSDYSTDCIAPCRGVNYWLRDF